MMEIVNDFVCPFCSNDLEYKEHYDWLNSIHLSCPNQHLRVWFKDKKWVVLRVLFNGFYLRTNQRIMEIRKGDGNTGKFSYGINIIPFDLFKYSYSELEKKIKILMVFS